MKYTVLSLFPEITDAFFRTSIMAKAIERGIVEYAGVNIRDYARDRHKTCDDAPYGGGAGMLMMAEPLARALDAAGAGTPGRRTVYLSPSGKPFNQCLAKELSEERELVLICGRYEGIDQRIIDIYVDDEISVGDYVLSSGETAALVLIDASYRLLGDVISTESLNEESFSGGLLEYPQYTRPEIYASIHGEMRVPEVLLSGHHENIRRWRLRKRIEKTLLNRPDLLYKGIREGFFDDEIRGMVREVSGITEEYGL
ncbi:MAG: tRNA (guanosine(37)-N1)-methyltransferase TrmD [Spirochaetaceae bacterium]|jgi:tRNA (guanine37-N1)-methyltransferase|nr:tRNA (guanosine(37)-N1)-methyltransferase TrmD [Spirochaetaceae bacterium]